MLQKDSGKTSHAENDRYRHRVRDTELEGIPQENFRRTHWTGKVKSRSHYETRSQRHKKTLQRSAKQKQSKKVKSVLKISTPTELGNTSNALKKHAEKLTEAKKRLQERNAIKFQKKEKSNLKTKETRPQKYVRCKGKSKKSTGKIKMNSENKQERTAQKK